MGAAQEFRLIGYMINTMYIEIKPPGIDLHIRDESLLFTIVAKIFYLGQDTQIYIKYYGQYSIYRK